MVLAIVIALLVVGSVLFHIFSPWKATPLASNWGNIDTALDITLWVTGAVFVAVNLFLAYCVFAYRHRKGHKAHYEPENSTLERRLTVLTGIGVVAMLAPGLLAWREYIAVPDDAMTVEAMGQQWSWSYRFPGPDGVLGSTKIEHVSAENPFGLNPKDPWGRDDVIVESPEVHLPINRPVKILLRSKDVLHNFYVPQFRAKMDLVPGLITYFWMTPTKEGTYEILCAEYCGVGHHAMRGFVVVEDFNSFQSWLGEWPTFGQLMPAVSSAEPEADEADGDGHGNET